ncbi:AAA domain-containing protein [Bacteroides neonati]|uniref:AAA domain-containing protein n=1 Tax=Bacteroides neonati TaxID=1347393 RepID=UPI001E59C926|nr:AAA domain-containing protein [Bacteroides neonati]
MKQSVEQAGSIIEYFRDILTNAGEISFDIPSDEPENKNVSQISSDMLLKALDKIDVSEPRSALSNYLDATNPLRNRLADTLIYPFGCNESQKLAVETAFANGITIVEGPPGTGKTQTILNIIANLIVQNKTVAIVSNNNSAVFNVREKLQKYGYGMVVASLGNNENIQTFFDNLKTQGIDETFELPQERLIEAKSVVKNLDSILTQCFQYRNKLATLKTQLSDTELEFSHIKSEQPISESLKVELDKKFYRKWSCHKALKLKDKLSGIGLTKKLPIIDKLRFVLQYGLFDMSTIHTYREEFNVYLNHKFYELYIDKLQEEIASIEKWLSSNNEDSNLKQFVDTSKEIFNALLFKKYKELKSESFTAKDYRNRFNDFVKHYPVILSSTLSLKTCIGDEYLFDYLIIDESSQVDIIKSAVCFSCCRNVVIVGDSMQLSHIIDPKSKEIAEQLKKTHHIAPAYDYVEQNILNSLKCLYGDNIKSVLLKEHYRCHPTIIGFCNKKYYNNNLVIMTNGDNHPFRIIETNISGGRGKYNQRQLDETELYIKENYSDDYNKVGVIAPYRDHADMLKERLPAGAEADTIHKYQGREKDTIIFNTVRNQINEFIDNPNLINVAVSRAVKEFIVVKPESMELPHGTNIGDMIRYICYTTDPKETIVKGKICSVFDLLYKEYNKVFATFIESNNNIKGSAAEIIAHKLLQEEVLLPNSQYSSIDMAREYKLRDLIRDYELLSEDEVAFIKHNARLDFLLYSKIDKTPILAIEVDGVSFHNNELQQERDNKKNHILEIIGLPLLRLSTDGHSEKAKIIDSLSIAMGLNS